MGDAYRFTLLPVFVDPGTDFRCHVTLQRPEVLYQLWFYVSILGTDFETPQVRRTVRADDLEYLSGGQYQVEFLTVEHSAGIQLQDEFILTGRRGASGRWNHTLNSVHGGRNYPPPPPPTQSVDQGRFPVHSISSTILVTSTQFATPFGYSTSSWVRGNSCVKDIGRFRPVQKTHGGGQKVNVVTTLAGGQGHFEYWVKSVVNPPHLKFTIPGSNVSFSE